MAPPAKYAIGSFRQRSVVDLSLDEKAKATSKEETQEEGEETLQESLHQQQLAAAINKRQTLTEASLNKLFSDRKLTPAPSCRDSYLTLDEEKHDTEAEDGGHDAAAGTTWATNAAATTTKILPPPPPPTTPTTHRRNAPNGMDLTLIAFVNSASGGGLGSVLLSSLSTLLGPECVFDLKKMKPGNMPEDALLPYALDPHVRVIAAGGDGTAGWIESSIDDVWRAIFGGDATTSEVGRGGGEGQGGSYRRDHLPLVPLPLGTGNDLSRSYGWGGKFHKKNATVDGAKAIVARVCNAMRSDLDRWRCAIMPDAAPVAGAKDWMPHVLSESVVNSSTGASVATEGEASDRRKTVMLRSLFADGDAKKGNRKEKKAEEAAAKEEARRREQGDDEFGETFVFDGIFNNYLSVGFDAKIAHEFHVAREANPEKFNSVVKNKMVYAAKGIKEINGKSLKGRIRVLVSSTSPDGEGSVDDEVLIELPIPKSCRAVVLLNIPSYGGGLTLARGTPPKPDDGKLEVLFVTGPLRVAALGAARSKAPSPLKIRVASRSSRVVLRATQPGDSLHFQVDGEPWVQRGPCTVGIRWFGRCPLLRRRRDGGGGMLASCGCASPSASRDAVVKAPSPPPPPPPQPDERQNEGKEAATTSR